MKARAGWVIGVACGLCGGGVRADLHPGVEPSWIPTVSLGLGSFDDRLRERIDGVDYASDRGQLRTALALGLVHPVRQLHDPRVFIDGHASLGVGVTFHDGHWELPLREDVTLAYAVNRWLTLRAGLGVGLVLDTSASSRSSAEIALPLSATLFQTIELVYRPMLDMPLGSERSPVLGGDRMHSTSLAVLPFELTLRVRIGALGW